MTRIIISIAKNGSVVMAGCAVGVAFISLAVKIYYTIAVSVWNLW